MSLYPNVERRDTGPDWMDKTAYTEAQRLADRAALFREREERSAQPAVDAIRALHQDTFTEAAAIVIIRALSCRIAESAWAGTDAGETAVGTLDDLSDDMEVL